MKKALSVILIAAIILFVYTILLKENETTEDINEQQAASYNTFVLVQNIETFENMQTAKTMMEEIVNSAPIEEQTEPTSEPLEEKDIVEVKQEELAAKIEELDNIEDKKEWFLTYKELVFKYAKWVDPPETVFDVFSEEEIRLVCRMVETECYQQDFESKVNVASVAFNRLESGKFGDTMTEIITTPKQFAYGRRDITEDSILAVQYAFEIEDTTQGALYFHSNPKTNTFNGADYIFTDLAGHHFYK